VHEHVFGTILRLNETEALRRIEELHRAGHHALSSWAAITTPAIGHGIK
jgi:hypothetical protein